LDFVRAWWEWCSESFGHMFLGVTAPILVVFAFLVLVLAGGGDGSLPQPPRSDVAGVCIDASSGAGTTSCASRGPAERPDGLTINTATPVPPTPTPAPRTYVVRSGDTLSVICATELPQLRGDACVDLIVEMSGLDGPDAIYEGQALRLPGGASPAGTASPRRTPVATRTPESAGEPEPTAVVETEPEPTATSEPEPDAVTEPEPTATAPAAGVLTPVGGDDEDGEQQAGDSAEDATQDEAEETPDGALVPRLGDIDVEGATLPHDFDMSNAHVYVVEPGESLLSICFDQYPDLPAAECVRIIVALNGLGGADEIFANQGIMLP
jgi:LysM repeat protein